MDFPQLPPN